MTVGWPTWLRCGRHLLVKERVPCLEAGEALGQRQHPHLLGHLGWQRAHAETGLLRKLEAKHIIVPEGVVVVEQLLEHGEGTLEALDVLDAHLGAPLIPLLPREDTHLLTFHLPCDHQHERVGRLVAQVAA